VGLETHQPAVPGGRLGLLADGVEVVLEEGAKRGRLSDVLEREDRRDAVLIEVDAGAAAPSRTRISSTRVLIRM
jgi:hypothetical protein